MVAVSRVYFSLMMATDTEKLATDSSLSTHPASVSALMALPQAREARPQTREVRHRRHWWRGTTRQRRRSYRRARRRAGVEQLTAPHRAELERRVAEPRACLGRQLAPSGQARLVKHRAASEAIRRARRATQPGNMPENGSSEAIVRVEKMVKEEMGEQRRGAILAHCLSGLV